MARIDSFYGKDAFKRRPTLVIDEEGNIVYRKAEPVFKELLGTLTRAQKEVVRIRSGFLLLVVFRPEPGI